MQTFYPKNHLGWNQPEVDQFFERHLNGVVVRLEARTRRAIARQKAAWRDTIRREAVLEGKDFEPNGDEHE